MIADCEAKRVDHISHSSTTHRKTRQLVHLDNGWACTLDAGKRGTGLDKSMDAMSDRSGSDTAMNMSAIYYGLPITARKDAEIAFTRK